MGEHLVSALWMVWRIIFTPIFLLVMMKIWLVAVYKDEDVEVRTVSYKEEIDCGE